MLTIAKLFGKSPFAPLQTHMDKVGSCVELLTKIFEILPQGNLEEIERLAHQVSKLEHEADITKNDIRNHLPKSLFLPIDRSHFLEMLSLQDHIADQAEDIALMLTLRPLEEYKNFKNDIQLFFAKSVDVFWSAKNIIREIDELLESSFGGIEAQKVKSMVELTAFKEHEARCIQRKLMKELFSPDNQLSAPSFYHWLKLLEEIISLANLSEKLGNRIRMVLELK
jgi:uncharacterized protein